MARVATNKTGMSYAVETSLATLPGSPAWQQLEPNSINRFGASVSTVARTPISLQRERRKGTITDQDSGVEFEADTTLSHVRDFAESFVMSNATNDDLMLEATAIDAAGLVTVAALNATQAGKLLKNAKTSSLFVLRGFGASTDGLYPLNTQPADTNTTLDLDGTTVAQTGLTNSKVELAGVRGLAGQAAFTWSWDATAKRATLTAAASSADFATLGLSVGQSVHVGSLSGTEVVNAFENSEANDMYGLARIVSITPAALVFDKVDVRLQFNDADAPTTDLDILFSQFIRTVSVDDAAFLERSYAFELALPDLGGVGTDMYEYSRGNYCNTMSFNIPLTDKSTVSFGFEGTTTDKPSATREAGAGAAKAPLSTAPFNTTADIARLRLDNIDNSGLTTDFKSLTMTINNNVSGEKKLGTLGPAFMNVGILNVDIEAQVIFTEAAVIDAIRCNTTVTMDFALANADGGLVVDIPNMTLSGGDKELPQNESVLLNTTAQAFLDAASDFPYSIGLSLFPHLPTTHVC